MKLRLTIILLLITTLCAHAQSDSFRKQFDGFRQQVTSRHSDFRAQCNKTYSDFLKKSWAKYHSIKVEKPEEKPAPPVQYDNGPVYDSLVVVKDTVKSAPIVPKPEPLAPVAVTPKQNTRPFYFEFYGDSLSVRTKKSFSLNSISEIGVADAWNEMSDSRFDATLEDCLRIRDEHRYCDWAYLQMVYSFAEKYTSSEDKATVLAAWLLCQSGYKIRLARADKHLYLLFASDYTIFGANRYTVKNEKFYGFNCPASSVEIADECRFPKERGVSFSFSEQPVLGTDYSKVRKLQSKEYQQACVESRVNQNLLKFLATYPDTQYGENYMTRWAMYAEAPLDILCKNSLYPSLREAIRGHSEVEAANILLNFVQTAFKYETDDTVWGHDRIFFSEETLFYDYCDCEDRAILFSRLVRDLLGLDVALVYYPNHLATAVRFNAEVPGSYFTYDASKFTVCDPTYIGAPVGAVMKGKEQQEVKIILLNR